MKYLIRLIVVCSLLGACTQEEQEQKEEVVKNEGDTSTSVGPYTFTIDVEKIESEKFAATLDATKGELEIFKDGGFVPLEKHEGKYIINNKLPQLGRLMVSLEDQILLVFEEGQFSGVNKEGEVTISSSRENHNLQWFNSQYEAIMNEKSALDQEYMAKGDIRQNTQLQQEYSSKLAELDVTFEKKLKAFSDTISPSFVGMLAVSRLLNEKNMSNLAPIIEQYRNEGFHYAKELVQEYDRRKQTTIGFKAPDFKLSTPSGESMKLSSLRGKVVLIDFWASWCGPCRKENPNVLRMYNKYKDKGFDIIGVSLDKDASQWEMAIDKDGLTWNHVWDEEGKVSGMYAVNAIPQTFLLDEKGVIIAKNLRGASLERKLEEIL